MTPLLALPDAALERLVKSMGGPPHTRGVPMDLRASLLVHLDRRMHVPLERLSPNLARAEADRRVAVTLGARPDGVWVEELRVESEAREGLRVLLYRPRVKRRGPLVVLFHSGGFVLGRPEWTTPLASVLVGTLAARVISVAYRLSPEHRLPAIQRDALAAVGAARRLAKEIGASPSRWIVAGSSAGGHLAAWVAQHLPAKERPVAQLLLYPFLDVAAETRSRIELAYAHPLSESFLGWSRAHAFRGLDPFDPEVSPARRTDLRDLPPAVVATAGFDPLLDEGDTYAQRLAEAGVLVRHRRFLALPHGFSVLTGAVPLAGEALRTVARDLGMILAVR